MVAGEVAAVTEKLDRLPIHGSAELVAEHRAVRRYLLGLRGELVGLMRRIEAELEGGGEPARNTQ